MSTHPQIVLASNNHHKLNELEVLLQELPISVRSQSNWNLPSAEETGTTLVENALIKARHACLHIGLPALADDSGLVIPILDGEPGVRSARYAGDCATDIENYQLVLSKLAESGGSLGDCKAYFYSTLVYLNDPHDPTPVISTGAWHGHIVKEPRGSNGFGYDPIFQPDGFTQTAAELDPATKNQISHRGQAAKLFVKLLEERLSD